MNQTIHILKKEFRSYFTSPIAYIVISVFLLVTGWFFFSTFFIYNQASMRYFFNLLPMVFSFIIPAITMRLFAEELNIGSYEILLTMPVTTVDVILGKFLAGLSFICVMMIPTIAYPLIISFIGELDWGPVIGGYIGTVLLGASFTAIGLFSSSITRNQIVAFIIGAVICFALIMIDGISFLIPPSILGVVGYLGTNFHFQNIAKGVIDTRDIIYFLSIVFLGLYGAYLSIYVKK